MATGPTYYDLLLLFAILAFIPFLSAFTISYVRYGKLKAGMLGGLVGVIICTLNLAVFYPAEHSIWINGLISGLFGGIATVTYLSKYYPSYLPIKWNIKILFNRKSIILVIVVLVLLFSFTQYYSFTNKNLEFNITDPRDDIFSQDLCGDKGLNGHDDIDIVRLESRISDNNVILEMEIAEEIPNDTDTDVEYTFFIATDKQDLWTRQIDLEDMEKNGRILQAKIPIESLQDRKIFCVLAVATKPDMIEGLVLYDNCYNKTAIAAFIELILRILK
ncbi:MAG: hypothetical protein ACT6FB_00695 [Methanosarcinaceae archaeon]